MGALRVEGQGREADVLVPKLPRAGKVDSTLIGDP